MVPLYEARVSDRSTLARCARGDCHGKVIGSKTGDGAWSLTENNAAAWSQVEGRCFPNGYDLPD
jgi:hypothetical protein